MLFNLPFDNFLIALLISEIFNNFQTHFQISLPENLSAGTKIAEFDVTDPDGSESYQVELEGDGSKNFMANIVSFGKQIAKNVWSRRENLQ